MTERLAPTTDGITRAVELLRAGEVVAFPTDTVYGAAVLDAADLPKLFELKRRPVDRRIPILVADLSQAAGWTVDERAHALAARFWPGPLTLVLPGVEGTQAFRAPDHPLALELIRAAGPLFATSANVSDEPDTLDADEVLVAFATQPDELAAVLDGGPVPGGVASTVVDLTVEPARLLRVGPIGVAELESVVPVAP